MTLIIILISSLSIISTLIGVGLAYFLAKNKKIITFSFGFSAAVILLLAILELFLRPMGYAQPLLVCLCFFAGGLVLLILDYLLPHFHFANAKVHIQKKLLKAGYLMAIGLVIHDFPEGFSIASTYSLEKSWGILVGLAIALHNVPEEFIIALPFMVLKKFKPLAVLAILSALAEPSGAILGILTLNVLTGLALPLTAFAGGAMALIAVKELFPLGLKSKLHTEFYFGLIIGALSYFLLKFLI